MITKIKDFINKDVTFEDETKEFFTMIRGSTLIFMLFQIVSAIVMFAGVLIIPGIASVVLAIAGICILRLSVKIRRRPLFHAYWIYMMIWMAMAFLFFGDAIDMEIFMFPVVVTSFFATYDNFRGKFVFAFFSALLVGMVYCFENLYHPLFTFGNENFAIWLTLKILTIVAAFIMMFLVCWHFANTTQDAQIKLARKNRQLSREAMTDPLTGLPNRRNMFKTMDRIADQNAHNNFSCFCVAMGDIDFFKSVNDTRGHNCGDYVLKTLATMFLDFMKDKGTVCRWGGEEFFFYFPESNGDQIFLQMDQLRHQIEKYPFHFEDQDFTITMTFGVSEAHSKSTADDIVKEVDAKLYMGKERGRNQVVW